MNPAARHPLPHRFPFPCSFEIFWYIFLQYFLQPNLIDSFTPCHLSRRAPQAAGSAEPEWNCPPIGKFLPRARSGVRSALSGNWGLWGLGDWGDKEEG